MRSQSSSLLLNISFLATRKSIHRSKSWQTNKKILFEIAANSAFYLLNKRTLNQSFQKGNLVHILDRIITKNPHSLMEALGKVKEILPSQRDYSIITLDGKLLTRHFSDIVSASATKSNTDVMLIDPIQLIDWRDSISPNHLYPKIKLFLENFKKGHQVSIPEITHQGSESTTQQNNSEEDIQTGDQRLHQAMSSTSPTGLDALLQKVMDPHTQSEHLDKPKNLSASRRPKKKERESLKIIRETNIPTAKGL